MRLLAYFLLTFSVAWSVWFAASRRTSAWGKRFTISWARAFASMSRPTQWALAAQWTTQLAAQLPLASLLGALQDAALSYMDAGRTPMPPPRQDS